MNYNKALTIIKCRWQEHAQIKQLLTIQRKTHLFTFAFSLLSAVTNKNVRINNFNYNQVLSCERTKGVGEILNWKKNKIAHQNWVMATENKHEIQRSEKTKNHAAVARGVCAICMLSPIFKRSYIIIKDAAKSEVNLRNAL